MLKFNIEIKEGKIIYDKYSFMKYIQKQNNGKYIIEIKKFYKKRTIAQNKWYWKVLTILCEEFGYESNDELHHALKYTFLSDINDHGLRYSKSTTKLTTKEMIEYFNKIYVWSARNGINLPNPKSYF